VAMNTNTILERTMAGLVITIQILEESRIRDNNLSVQIGHLKAGQREQTQIIRELRQELSEFRNGQKEEAGQAGQAPPTARTSNEGKKGQKLSETFKNKKQQKSGNGNLPVGSNKRSTDINERQKAEAEIRFRLKMDQDGKNIHIEEFTPVSNRKRNRFQKSSAQRATEDKKREKNEEETGREIIFDGIPTPKTYQEGTKKEEAKRILAVLEELRPKYIGQKDGIHVVPSDFAYATKQQTHFKRDFKPLTARFRNKDTVEKKFHAAKVAGMLNKRKEMPVGKHRIPKPITVDGKEILPTEAAIQRAKERPETYIRRSRTEADREKDKATRIYRESLRYKESLEVKSFLKEQRVDFADVEADPLEDNEGEEGNVEEYGIWASPTPEVTEATPPL
jgi:hypothetical protein